MKGRTMVIGKNIFAERLKKERTDRGLYHIDPETATEETKQNLESARSLGVYSMSGMSFPVVVNGDVILARLDEHPEKDKIIEIFNNY